MSEASARDSWFMESITHYIERRLKLRVNRQKSAVAPPVGRPLLGFAFFRYRDVGRIGVTVAPKALKRAEDRIRQLTTRNLGVSMERRVKEINRFHGRMDGVLRVRRQHPAVREAREVAAPQATAGALEGVEAPTNALPEPPRARDPRPGRPPRPWAASQKGYWRVRGPGRFRPPCPTPTGTRPWA
jgi:RNA-directed DNA polymerase